MTSYSVSPMQQRKLPVQPVGKGNAKSVMQALKAQMTSRAPTAATPVEPPQGALSQVAPMPPAMPPNAGAMPPAMPPNAGPMPPAVPPNAGPMPMPPAPPPNAGPPEMGLPAPPPNAGAMPMPPGMSDAMRNRPSDMLAPPQGPPPANATAAQGVTPLDLRAKLEALRQQQQQPNPQQQLQAMQQRYRGARR